MIVFGTSATLMPPHSSEAVSGGPSVDEKVVQIASRTILSNDVLQRVHVRFEKVGSYEGLAAISSDGECVFHGLGTYRGNDFEYTGGFVNGLFHGQGERKKGNSVYKGEFQEGFLHGKGSYITSEEQYEGDFVKGRRHGSGELKDAQGKIIYQGEFQEDLFHGEGTYTMMTRERKVVYKGRFKRGKQCDGYGELTDDQGNFYAGNFVNGQKSGLGRMKWKDGSEYVGAFRYGRMHGDGILYQNGAMAYQGEFVDGKKQRDPSKRCLIS